MKITLRDTLFQMKGIDPTQLDLLVLPIGLSGPLDSPKVSFDSSVLVDALEQAGEAQLSRQLDAQLEELGFPGKLEDELDLPGGLGDGLGDELEKGAKDALDDLLGGRKKLKF